MRWRRALQWLRGQWAKEGRRMEAGRHLKHEAMIESLLRVNDRANEIRVIARELGRLDLEVRAEEQSERVLKVIAGLAQGLGCA